MPDTTSKRPANPNFKVGEAVPEATFLDESGQKVNLSELWASGPVLLAFVRHYG